MSRAVYEYTKTVLEKVSFNEELFRNELIKATKKLLPYELKELEIWLSNFILNKPELQESVAQIELKKVPVQNV
ncbi:MAG: hypothetical protein ACPHXR_03670 [Flavicella sp.]